MRGQDIKRQAFKRTSRLIRQDGRWFFRTREFGEMGPYFHYDAAEKGLSEFVCLQRLARQN